MTSRRATPWLAAAVASAVVLLAFWPGYTSVDSAHQHAQALAGRYDNVHPPLFAWAWRQLLRLGDGSGPMHATLVAGFCTGLARLFAALPMRGAARWGAYAAMLAWPPVLLVAAHVWKDVALAAAMLFAAAATLRWHAGGRARDRVAALAWLAIAVAMRHNGWPAVLPFVALLARPGPAPLATRAAYLRAGAAALTFALALAAVPRAIEALLDAERRPLWPTVALWDLAAVSLATGEVRLPRAIAPALTLDHLRAHYRSWSCVPLYDGGQIRLALHVPYTADEIAAVDRAWIASVRDAPAAYLAHRARVFAGLAWRPPADAPRELVVVPEHRVGPVDREPTVLARAALAFAARAWSTPAFALAPYLLAVLAALPFARRGTRIAPVMLVASALLYAAPLFVVATSSEYRYVWWPVIACLAAAAASLGSRSASRRDLAPAGRRE